MVLSFSFSCSFPRSLSLVYPLSLSHTHTNKQQVWIHVTVAPMVKAVPFLSFSLSLTQISVAASYCCSDTCEKSSFCLSLSLRGLKSYSKKKWGRCA